MHKRLMMLLVAFALVAGTFSAAGAYEALNGPTGVLKYVKGKALDGYTLFSPMVNCKTVYLVDNEGNLVHKWETQYPPGLYAELLPNGNLLRGMSLPNKPTTIGGAGGGIQEIDWNGKVVWEYKMISPTEIQHHTWHRMPNGNTQILGWEYKSNAEAIAKGRDPKSIPTAVFGRGKWHYGFWVDFVREVNKDGLTVWEWHAWDHIGPGPNQLDINYYLPKPVGDLYSDFDWSHFNTVGYIEETDEVIMNSRNLGEFYIISRKTGEIVYRWGNPAAYGQGRPPSFYDDGDQKTFGQHSVIYVGKDRFLIFDNGSERPEGNRSRAVEMDRKTGKVVWEYEAKHSNSFYSYRQGGVQRLPNGNTFITSTHGGHLIEVTPGKEIVWEYVSPIQNNKAVCLIEDGDGHNMIANQIHRAFRYGKDYPGLQGKDLSAKTPLTDCPEFWKIWKNDK